MSNPAASFELLLPEETKQRPMAISSVSASPFFNGGRPVLKHEKKSTKHEENTSRWAIVSLDLLDPPEPMNSFRQVWNRSIGRTCRVVPRWSRGMDASFTILAISSQDRFRRPVAETRLRNVKRFSSVISIA